MMRALSRRGARMSTPNPGTAVARREVVEGLPSRPLQKIEDLADALEGLRERANLVCPVASVDHIMAMHQVSLRAVMLDPEHDCYSDPRFCKPNERAPGKTALAKVMAAAGAQVLKRDRLDDPSDPNY